MGIPQQAPGHYPQLVLTFDPVACGLQSRLRWILKPGNEFYVVLNHSWQENEMDRFESAQTRFRIKLNYTFRF